MRKNPCFMLTMRYYKGDTFSRCFAFHAADKDEAKSKVQAWGRKHGFSLYYPKTDTGDLDFRPATAAERESWLHDEYMEHL